MILPGALIYILACWAAYLLVRHPLSRRQALGVLLGFLVLGAIPLVWGWIASEGAGPFTSKRPAQWIVVSLYGMYIALLPAGLLRPFARRRWAAPSALVLALLLPFLGIAAVSMFGDRLHEVSDGIGHLGDLLCLDPSEMGEGVSHAGAIPHRFRVHHLALVGMALCGCLLQFLPVPPARTATGSQQP